MPREGDAALLDFVMRLSDVEKRTPLSSLFVHFNKQSWMHASQTSAGWHQSRLITAGNVKCLTSYPFGVTVTRSYSGSGCGGACGTSGTVCGRRNCGIGALCGVATGSTCGGTNRGVGGRTT